MEDDPLVNFGISYAQFYKAIRNACAAAEFRSEPEDIQTDVFLALSSVIEKNPKKFSSPKHLLGYVFTTAYHLAVRPRDRPPREKLVDPFDLTIATDERTADTRPAFPTADQLLDSLHDCAPEIRDVVRLALEGLQQKEIASRLGLSRATVCRRMKEARARFQERFPDHFGPREKGD